MSGRYASWYHVTNVESPHDLCELVNNICITEQVDRTLQSFSFTPAALGRGACELPVYNRYSSQGPISECSLKSSIQDNVAILKYLKWGK